jgi:Ca2+:H+ antiporter
MGKEEVALWRKFLDPRVCGFLNLLLPCIIVAGVLYLTDSSFVAQFVFACLAIVPLSAIMGDATEVVAEHLGPTPGALMNATMGNACEMILSIIGVFKGIDAIVKASLTGSIIGNLLLVLGMALVAGGLRFKVQHCDKMAVGVYGNMALLASILLILPALFANSLPLDFPGRKYDVDVVSVGASIVLIITYVLQLVFQLRTHKSFFGVMEEKPEEGKKGTEMVPVSSHVNPEEEVIKPSALDNVHHPLERTVSALSRPNMHEEDEEEELMTLPTATIILAVATVLVAMMSEVLVSSVERTATLLGLSDVFTGIVIIAIVGNAAEHSTAIVAAYKNKLDISVAIAFGSSLQIALFVFPLIILISCARDQGPMTMVFTNMEAVAIFFAVLTAWVICSDSETTWLEGVMLLSLYLVFSLLFFFVPDEEELFAHIVGNVTEG